MGQQQETIQDLIIRNEQARLMSGESRREKEVMSRRAEIDAVRDATDTIVRALEGFDIDVELSLDESKIFVKGELDHDIVIYTSAHSNYIRTAISYDGRRERSSQYRELHADVRDVDYGEET